jgi:hypothetical protein
MRHPKLPALFLLFISVCFICNTGCYSSQSAPDIAVKDSALKSQDASAEKVAEKKVLDTALFKKLQLNLANNDTTGKWPAKMPYPLPGAVLPFHRIVAFYGNLYSKKNGHTGRASKK